MQPSKDWAPELIHSNGFSRQSSDMPPPIAVEEPLHLLCFIDYLISCDQLWGHHNVWFVLISRLKLLTLLSVRTVDYHWMLLLMSEYWSSVCPCCVSRFWEGEKRLSGQHVSWSGGWSSSNSGSVQTLTPHSSSCSGSVLYYLCL